MATNRTTSETTVNGYADAMLSKINMCIQEAAKKNLTLTSGIVSHVNSNGTVDVYFPPEKTKVFTNVSNQTAFTLKEGDGVEIMMKNGSYNNCWIIAKHQTTSTGIDSYAKTDEVTTIIKGVLDEQQYVNTEQTALMITTALANSGFLNETSGRELIMTVLREQGLI